MSGYRHQKTTSNNTEAFVHVLVNFSGCARTCFPWKFNSQTAGETR